MTEFVLAGFRQDNNLRSYTFQDAGVQRKKTQFTVVADLVLVRKYRIPMQELSLLCRKVLEGSLEKGDQRHLTFTEADMISYSQRRDADTAAAELKRSHRGGRFFGKPEQKEPPV